MSTMDGHNPQRQDADTNVSMMERGQNQMILNELPPPDTKRWVVRRKAAVVAAVKNGAITLDSEPGRGTCALIQVPRCEESERDET